MSITRRHILATFAAASVLGTSAMAQAADTVRIGLPTKTYWPTTIAETAVRQKLFDKEGIKAELTIYRGGAETFEAMAAGAADVILDATSLVSAGRTKGVNSKVVANAAMGYYGWQLMTLAKSTLGVADLKGKKVALNKGSNVHYLLVKALEKAGVKYSEIEPVFLAPADARAAFERGAVDAWVIWDPFQAAAEAATGARTLADGSGIVANYQFYFSSKKFLESDPKIVDEVLAQLGEVDDWAKGDIHAVAEQLAPAIGLSVPVVEVALKRQSYGIKPLTDSVINDQQQVADTFFTLGLIPKQIKISDVARRSGS